NDFFSDKSGIPLSSWASLETYMVTNTAGIRLTDITHSSDTVMLGEKEFDHGDFYMDLGENGGNDWSGILDQSRPNRRGPKNCPAGSKFTMADGSSRFIKYGQSLWPLTLWCISDANRSYFAYKSPGMP